MTMPRTVTMTFVFPAGDDSQGTVGADEFPALVRRMFEAAANLAVDPFISEELFTDRELRIDDDLDATP